MPEPDDKTLIETLRAEIADLKKRLASEDKDKLQWDIRVGVASLSCVSTPVTVLQVGAVVVMLIRESGEKAVIMQQKSG